MNAINTKNDIIQEWNFLSETPLEMLFRIYLRNGVENKSPRQAKPLLRLNSLSFKVEGNLGGEVVK